MSTEVSDSLPAPSSKNIHARHLFDGIARDYDMPAQVFSLFQYRRWRTSLISQLKLNPHLSVFDVATGPAGVAIEIARKAGCRITGMDISDRMLEQARENLETANLTSLVTLVKGRAENIPFPDHSFDVVVFTFLLRYVDDPQAVMKELARVLKPGGQMASLEFYVPQGPILHPLWFLHTRLVMPVSTRFMSTGWQEVGSFLGPNISDFFKKYTLQDLNRMWMQAGLSNVQTRILSQGGAFIMWGWKGE